MITTPEIACDVFSFLDKDRIERIQLVNQFWNNVIIRHKNIWPLRQIVELEFNYDSSLIKILLYLTKEGTRKRVSYVIKFDGTNLIKIEEDVSSRYSQLTVDEVLTNLNDVVFDYIRFEYCYPDRLDDLLNLIKLVTTKTGDNYIIVDELLLDRFYRPVSYIKKVCANPETRQLPSTPKEIRLADLYFKEYYEVLNFTCNGIFNGANRLTIEFYTPVTNYGNFIRQWFELYRTHQSPISLVGKFELRTDKSVANCVLDAVKTFINNIQLRVKYSLETKEFHQCCRRVTYQYFIRRCVLHETDSYALVIEMAYEGVTEISSIKALVLDQPSCDKMTTISFCVKSL